MTEAHITITKADMDGHFRVSKELEEQLLQMIAAPGEKYFYDISYVSKSPHAQRAARVSRYHFPNAHALYESLVNKTELDRYSENVSATGYEKVTIKVIPDRTRT